MDGSCFGQYFVYLFMYCCRVHYLFSVIFVEYYAQKTNLSFL